jgi:hypothetical protein
MKSILVKSTLTTSLLLFFEIGAGFILIPDNAYSRSDNIYCYAEDQEGYICFETLKKCVNEQKDDMAAESRCYKDADN